jgi:Flp pilus assembly protein TadD
MSAAAAPASYERGLAIYPTASAWAGLGILREAGGDRDGAMQAYRAAPALDPDDVPALAGAARYWLAQGRRARARELLERAAALAPSDAAIRADVARAGPGTVT